MSIMKISNKNRSESENKSKNSSQKGSRSKRSRRSTSKRWRLHDQSEGDSANSTERVSSSTIYVPI